MCLPTSSASPTHRGGLDYGCADVLPRVCHCQRILDSRTRTEGMSRAHPTAWRRRIAASRNSPTLMKSRGHVSCTQSKPRPRSSQPTPIRIAIRTGARIGVGDQRLVVASLRSLPPLRPFSYTLDYPLAKVRVPERLAEAVVLESYSTGEPPEEPTHPSRMPA